MAANLLSFDFIRGRLSPEQLEDLAVSLGICLECGGNLVVRDCEVVCSRCGMVWGLENTADYVPFQSMRRQVMLREAISRGIGNHATPWPFSRV